METKTLDTIQKLSKIGKVLSKIVFVVSVIGFFCYAAGIVGLTFGNGSLDKIGSAALRRFISSNNGYNIKSIVASFYGLLVVYAGAAVLSKFAEDYFKNELEAGTPFTFDGAKELKKLGILTIAVPLCSAALGSIVTEIAKAFLGIGENAGVDIQIENETSIALGIVFIIISLICRYGAELAQNSGSDN